MFSLRATVQCGRHSGLTNYQASGASSIAVDIAYTEAQKNVRASRLTDLEFTYSPSQIALAAFRLVTPELVDRWLRAKEAKRNLNVTGDNSVNAVEQDLTSDKLSDSLVNIGIVISNALGGLVDKEAVKDVDRRLRWAHNPEKDPQSAL